MKKIIFSFLIAQVTLISCSTEDGNEKLGQASEKVGKSAATVVKSVKEGIEKVAKIKIDVSESLKAKGISTGKVTLNSKNGRHNLLNVYLIFDKNINRNITLKVYDSEGLEMGRAKALVKGIAGEAKYFDFLFFERTNIDRDNKIIME